MEWTAEAIERLRALWADGLSTAEIGRRMGVSKNAVVGKAHRLNLSARPSPIRRDATPRPAAPPRPVTPRPAPQPRAMAARIETAAPPAPPPAPVVAVQAAPPKPAAPAIVRPFARIGARSCCWPLGEPGTSEFRFCAAESMAGKPYCAAHAAVAYVKARDRREDAA